MELDGIHHIGLNTLEAHGVRFQKLQEPRWVVAEVFLPATVRRQRKVFQKHFQVTIEGRFEKREIELPTGTVWVPGRQRLARLAAQDLEAVSEDSLATWNYFDDRLHKREDGSYPPYPVVRVLAVK